MPSWRDHRRNDGPFGISNNYIRFFKTQNFPDRLLRQSTFAITANGWDRIEELEAARPSTTQAFVAMWFSDTMLPIFKEGLAPAIEDAGYEPLRIDNKEHVNKIDDEIIAEIRRSRFLVADFTCEPGKVRGGVYFEAGFAMGLGIPVFWTVRGTTDDIHFDTRQYHRLERRGGLEEATC